MLGGASLHTCSSWHSTLLWCGIGDTRTCPSISLFSRDIFLGRFFPSLAFCHLELFDLIVVEDFRRLLLVVPWFFFVSVGAPLTLSFLRRFIAVIQLLVEDGRKVHLEAVHENVQVEAVEVNDPLVDILSVEALATVFEEKLREAVHRPQKFCCECVFGRNSVFVDDAVFVDLFHKIQKLSGEDAVLAEDKPTANEKAFNW